MKANEGERGKYSIDNDNFVRHIANNWRTGGSCGVKEIRYYKAQQQENKSKEIS